MIQTQQSDFRWVIPLDLMACASIQRSRVTRSWPTAT